jgi:HD domain
MTRIAQRLPAAAWTNRLTLGVLGRAGGPVMGAGQIRLLGAVQASLAFAFERYDGGGLPAGAHGDEIPVQVRVAQVADMVEVHHRVYGVDGAVAMARSRRGGQFDPRVVDVFIQHADAVLAGPPPVTPGRRRCVRPPFVTSGSMNRGWTLFLLRWGTSST